jgi:glycosyltransferase involved in cell wall biosynthesis
MLACGTKVWISSISLPRFSRSLYVASETRRRGSAGEWFLANVWPRVREKVPDARFDIFGFNPTPRVRKLAEAPGVNLEPDLPDLRDAVRRRQVVVLPFVSGGGIKNKLLEAAALGMPIVCTPNALSGTKGKPGVRVAHGSQEWTDALVTLWGDPEARRTLGADAREWVTRNHTWDSAAATAEDGIQRSLQSRNRGGTGLE